MIYLPEEIIYEVLLGLPPKSLVRFRCVSKGFCAIIDSRYFIDSHLHTSRHRKLITLRRPEVDPFPDKKVRVLKLGALDFNHKEEELELEQEQEQEYWPINYYLLAKRPFFSHCNGLVVFYVSGHKVCVWNPSTQKRWLTPACPFCLTSDYYSTMRLGFGYDSISDDYKALLILTSKTLDVFQVWIIELRRKKNKSNNNWRRVEHDFPYKDNICCFSGFNRDGFVDGAMHFWCLNVEQDLITIVAFDVANETFSILSQTQLPGGPHHRILCLDVFEGCLSIRINPTSPSKEDQNDHPQVVQLYVQSSTNNNSCDWTKLYSVEGLEPELFRNCLSYGRFLGYSNQEPGNKIFLLCFEKIYSYHLSEKTLQQEFQISHKILDCFLCVESLVSL